MNRVDSSPYWLLGAAGGQQPITTISSTRASSIHDTGRASATQTHPSEVAATCRVAALTTKSRSRIRQTSSQSAVRVLSDGAL
jgi:hypothetical protein